MDETAIFMSVIAKIMKTEDNKHKEYNKLYSQINNDFITQLNRSHYPKAPKIISDFNSMLNDIETAFLCPEMFRKTVYQIDCVFINKALKTIKDLFKVNIDNICKIKTIVPYIVSNSKEFKLSVINYNNVLIDISPAEIKVLSKGCYNSKIDVSKLIRFIKIQAPLNADDIAVIISKPHTGMGIFSRFVYKYISCLIGGGKNSFYQSDKYEFTVDENNINSVVDFITKNKAKMMYGFMEQYQAISIAVLSYFTEVSKKSGDIKRAITNDIARIHNSSKEENELKKFRNKEEDKLNVATSEFKAFNSILFGIEKELERLCHIMGDKYFSDSYVKKAVFGYIFDRLFYAANTKDWVIAENCISKLKKMKFPEIEICLNYVDCVRDNKTLIIDTSKCSDWQTAKIVLAIIDVDKTNSTELERLVNLLKKSHTDTGKEFYARAIVEKNNKNDDACINNLKQSFEKGYSLAAIKLLALYEAGNKKIRLISLANALVPEACMKMAQQNVDKRNNSNYRIGLSSKELVYYKLAATKEYLPAIEKIVEVIFEERFSNVYQIREDDKNNPKYNVMKENGHILCGLCQYLIDKKYKILHFKELQGVVLFCLNENIPMSRQLLLGVNTPMANYCKGIMYEFGQGVSSDLNQAIEYYRKANGFGNSAHNLDRANNKLAKQQRYQYSSRNYSSSSSYSRTSSSSGGSSDSWCFITTAACAALQKGDSCEELMMLRKFRDEHISNTEEGQMLVSEYYRVAPLIINELDKLPNATDEYYELWTIYIKPSCRFIIESKWDEAKSIYIEMVKNLSKRFNISVDEEITKKYLIDRRVFEN